jgi:hypothetical protein
MANPTGESSESILRLDFDRRMVLQFRGRGCDLRCWALAYRELDDALSPSVMQCDVLAEALTSIVTLAKNRRFSSRFGWATNSLRH